MNSKIKEILSKFDLNNYFTLTKPENEIKNKTKQILGNEIPPSFLEFLFEYGQGGLDGVEVLGIGKNKENIFITETLKFRNLGLPNNLIVIENCDEWLYCINCDNFEIVSWNRDVPIKAYNNFEDYFLDRLNDALENMD